MTPVNDEIVTVQLKIRPATTNTSMTRPSSKPSTPATGISSPIRFGNKVLSMAKQQLQPRLGADREGELSGFLGKQLKPWTRIYI